MNSVVIFLAASLALSIGYILFKKILSKLFDVDDSIPTPAHTCSDGCDYVPVRHWTVLFGHHFSSIAGAGPIIGPVLAVAIWGWFPSLLWIVLGAIFMGGIHDFGSLMVSVKNKGFSVSDVAQNIISRRAKIIFGLFLFIIGIKIIINKRI